MELLCIDNVPQQFLMSTSSPTLLRFSHMLWSWTYHLTYTLKINKQDVCYFSFLIQRVRSQEWFFFNFLVLCNNMQNVFRAEPVSSRAKNQSIDIKSFYSNTSCGFEYKTKKATGFKSLRVNCWEINQGT